MHQRLHASVIELYLIGRSDKPLWRRTNAAIQALSMIFVFPLRRAVRYRCTDNQNSAETQVRARNKRKDSRSECYRIRRR